MARKKKNTGKENQQFDDEVFVDIIEEDDYKGNFLEDYQNYILIGVAVVLLIVGGYFAYKFLMLAPKEKEAMAEMMQAEKQFEKDSFALALDNPGEGYSGFLGIIEDYSGTKSANTAKYYAGISYLNLGIYDAAIEYLKEYDANELVTTITKYGAMGDAYSELDDMDNAKIYYTKAVKVTPNELLTPYYLKKLAMLLKSEGNQEGANKYFQRIKDEFPKSTYAQDIEKYIFPPVED